MDTPPTNIAPEAERLLAAVEDVRRTLASMTCSLRKVDAEESPETRDNRCLWITDTFRIASEGMDEVRGQLHAWHAVEVRIKAEVKRALAAQAQKGAKS